MPLANINVVSDVLYAGKRLLELNLEIARDD